MSSLFAHNRTIVRMSLLLPGISMFLLMAFAPGRVHSSTYAAVIALGVGIGAVVWLTWRHAQPVASLRQELYAINHPAARARRGSNGWRPAIDPMRAGGRRRGSR